MNDNDRNQPSFEEEEGGMDLSAASDLEGELVSEPWVISAGRSFGRFLAKIGVGILGCRRRRLGLGALRRALGRLGGD